MDGSARGSTASSEHSSGGGGGPVVGSTVVGAAVVSAAVELEDAAGSPELVSPSSVDVEVEADPVLPVAAPT